MIDMRAPKARAKNIPVLHFFEGPTQKKQEFGPLIYIYIYEYIYFRNESSEHNDPEYRAYYVQWPGIKYITDISFRNDYARYFFSLCPVL